MQEGGWREMERERERERDVKGGRCEEGNKEEEREITLTLQNWECAKDKAHSRK